MKLLLVILSVLFVLVVIPGFFLTRGWLIFLFFQLLTFWIVIYMFITAGAAAGFGIHRLANRGPGKTLDAAELDDYVELAVFSNKEGLDEARALTRIKNGYYKGGMYQGTWYIHQSELSDAGARQD